MTGLGSGFSLICRVGAMLCALPLEHVLEVMRPLPVEVLSGTPAFVSGVAIVRGAALPVVAIARVLGEEASAPHRLVLVRTGERRVALAVDSVLGIRALPPDSAGLPPLLRDAPRETVGGIGTLDGELLVVLQAAHIVPDEVFSAAGMERGAA